MPYLRFRIREEVYEIKLQQMVELANRLGTLELFGEDVLRLDEGQHRRLQESPEWRPQLEAMALERAAEITGVPVRYLVP